MELTDETIAQLTKSQIISQDVIYSLFDIQEEYERIRLTTMMKLRANELGFESDFNKVIKHFSEADKRISDNNKKSMMDAIKASKGELYNREYICESKNGFVVQVSLLADYIKNNFKYIFARSEVKSGVERYVYDRGVYRHVSDNEFKGYIKNHIPLELQLPKYINDTYNLLLCDTENHTELNSLNSNENIINFQNGLLYLDSMELKPHTPDVYSTIQIPCNYNPNATAPINSTFDKFINHLCYNDAERVNFILQFMGVALSNIAGYRMKKSLFMVGKGDTGKSQCKELLNKLIGSEYFSSIELKDLEERFGASSLYGKRVGGSNDMKYMNISQLGAFKQLTGGDNVRVEYKGESAFNFKYQGVLWFCMNDLPKFGGDHGDWVYSRILILECNNPVPKKDPFLLDKMYEEREYIVNLCIKATRKVVDNGYNYDVPACCSTSKDQYKVENNSVLRFIAECTEPRTEDKYTNTPTTGQVYNAYKSWCRDNVSKGYYETMPMFRKILDSIDYGDVKKVGDRYYSKFVLTHDTKRQYLVYDILTQ